jgi:CheY-like chemotaxis protein
MNILHIDDNPEIREMYSEMLSKDNSVTSVSDGRKGLSLVAENDFDLILLDMYMPKYSGVKFLHDLKKIRPSELKRVIVVSLLDFNEDQVKEFLKFGILSVEKKPMDLKGVKKIEKSLLSKKNAIAV